MGSHRQRFVVARKDHCCGDCGHTIKAGDRYLAYTGTPWSEFNDSDHWLCVAFCAACSTEATEYPPRITPDETR